jgi:photosystem II stability/assembly factor-like uncharacterized protein
MHSFSLEFEYAEWKRIIELRNFNSYWDSNKNTTNINSFAVMGADIYVTTGQGVILSSDNLKNWSFVNNGLPDDTNVESLAICGTDIFATTNEGVFLSSDNCANWIKLKHDLLEDNDVRMLVISGTNIFAATESGVLLSTDNGKNWVVQNAPKYEPSNGVVVVRMLSIFSDVEFLAINGTNIFAAAFKGLFFSSDNGVNWAAINNGLPANDHVISLALSGTNIFAGTCKNGVYFSSDNGSNWTAVNNGLPANACVDSLVINGKCIIAGVFKSGVFFSIDNGVNWTALNYDLPTNIRVNSLVISGNNIFAGTEGHGVWRRTLRDIDKIFVKSYYQAKLEILNAQGHLIKTIDVNEKAYVDVSDLPNGLFNVKIKFSHPHNMLNPNETDMSIYVNL